MHTKTYYGSMLMLIGILITFTANSANAQTKQKNAPKIKDKASLIKADNKVYNVAEVEQKPSFIGGDAALFKYLADSIKYPAMARENGIEGTVYVEFIIAKDGSVTNVVAKRKVDGGCTEEAIRVINAMPNWKPGKQQGNPVKATKKYLPNIPLHHPCRGIFIFVKKTTKKQPTKQPF